MEKGASCFYCKKTLENEVRYNITPLIDDVHKQQRKINDDGSIVFHNVYTCPECYFKNHIK